MMKIHAKVTCPYCNRASRFNCTLEECEAPLAHRTLYTCNEDRGGCGLDFVVDVCLPEPTVEIRKIEGEA